MRTGRRQPTEEMDGMAEGLISWGLADDLVPRDYLSSGDKGVITWHSFHVVILEDISDC